MTSTTTRARRVATFNVNQFSSPKHQADDLRARMAVSDIVGVQETVHLDLVAFAATVPGWAAFQIRHGDDDGHANTGVLYRTILGTPTATECIPLGDAADTRRRFLTAVQFDGLDWFGSLHIFPARDRRLIPAELAAAGAWTKAQLAAGETSVTLSLDKNQATIVALEKATGLTWHGVEIDGLLSSEPVTRVAAFKHGFSDHDGVHGLVTLPALAPPPRHRLPKPPAPPYLGPAAHVMHDSHGRPLQNMPVTRVVMHSTVSPCKAGGARDIARYFNSEAAGGSAHYIVDPGEVVQDVFDSVVAEHAPPNPNSLGIEMCDIPGPVPGDKPGTAAFKAALRVWRWRRPEQQQMLERAAKLCAQLCAAYHVPPVWIGQRALKAGKHGVTSHNNVSQTWHQSTHWDPGFWPRRRFMRLVRAEYDRLLS